MKDKTTASDYIELYEVGPRDGLQNEQQEIPTTQKIALIDALSGVGFRHIEATSFVSPKWVPQLADAKAVMAGITRNAGISYAALTPNQRGFDDALAAGIGEVAIFAAASEEFSAKNINASIAESMARYAPVARDAMTNNVALRGYVSYPVRYFALMKGRLTRKWCARSPTSYSTWAAIAYRFVTRSVLACRMMLRGCWILWCRALMRLGSRGITMIPVGMRSPM